MAKLSVKCDDHDMHHWVGAASKEGMSLEQWVSAALNARVDALCERLSYEEHPCSCWRIPDGETVHFSSR